MIFAVSLALAAPAAVQQAPAPAASPTPVAEKKICRREIPLGSMMPGKPVCRTKAEWRAIDTANGDAAHDALSRRNTQLNGR